MYSDNIKQTSLRKNTLWVFTGSISLNVIQFLFGIILARLLLPQAFGIVVTISVFTGVLGLVSNGGMSEALVQAKAVGRDDFNIVFTAQVLISLFIYAALYLISPFFSRYFNNEIYLYLLPVSALSFLLKPFVNTQMAILRRGMRFKEISIINIVTLIGSSIASIIFACFGFDVWSLIWGGLIGSVIKMVLMFPVTNWQPRLNFNIKNAKSLASYGAKNTTNQLIIYARQQLGNLIVSRALGPSALGLFNKGDSLGKIPLMIIGGSAYETVFRDLSGMQDDHNQSRYLYLQTLTLVCFYTFPIFIGWAWLTKPFLYLIYGENWLGAEFPLRIFCLIGVLRCLVIPSGAVIAARDKLKIDILLQLISLVLLLIGILIGLRWGLNGMILGTIPSIVFYCISSVQLASKTLHLKPLDVIKAVAPAMKLSIGMTITIFWFNLFIFGGTIPYDSWSKFCSLISIGGIIYSGSFLWFTPKGLELEAKKWKNSLRAKFFFLKFKKFKFFK